MHIVITVILNPGLFPVWGRLFKHLVVMSKFMPIPAFSVCINPLFAKLNIQFNFCVFFLCVTQAQTGETDAITATEHVHSTPQPEKVHTLQKHICKKSNLRSDYLFMYHYI